MPVNSKLEKIDGYKLASYEICNTPASENGLGGNKIYVTGTVEKIEELEGLVYARVQDEDKNPWIFGIGDAASCSTELPGELQGKTVNVFGAYQGLSGTENMPVALFDKLTIDGEEFDASLFAKDDDAIKEAVKAEAVPIDPLDYKDQGLENKYISVEGLVNKANHMSTLKRVGLTIERKTEDGFAVYRTDLSYDLGENLKDVKSGQGVILYGKVNEKGLIDYLFLEDKEQGFSVEDVKADFISRCETYAYSDYAHNPKDYLYKRAKMTGKVFQVIENASGEATLLVHVTKGKYDSYDDTVYMTLSNYDKEKPILEDDIVTFYGRLNGNHTYSSRTGDKSVPLLEVSYYER